MTAETIDQSFLEIAGAVERYTHGGSSDEFLKAAQKNIGGLGRLLSMQCVQASSARYMASIGKEFSLHTKNLTEIFSKLAMEPSSDWELNKRIVRHSIDNLRGELFWFQEFLLDNGFVSKKDLNDIEKMQAAIGNGKKMGVLSSLFNRVPKGLPGFRALIKAASANPDYMPEPTILGINSEIVTYMTLSIVSAIGIMAFFLQFTGQIQNIATLTAAETQAQGLILFGFSSIMIWLMKNIGTNRSRL